jgi:GT2 family glycosyltransferase
MNVQPYLAIIFVNWNGGQLLSRAVESIVAFPPSVEYEIVVVDNASTDDSLTKLQSTEAGKLLEARRQLRLIRNTENRGFGPANNQGFEITTTPLVLLLNPDAAVTAECIDRLITAVRADTLVAAAGPRILNADGSLQVSVWHNPPAAWNILLSNLKLYALLPKRLRGELLLGGHWQHDSKKSVPMLSGAAILARREVIDSVGGSTNGFICTEKIMSGA